MKIKELHLRNIASIEKADIDFAKDLVDGVTGDPASVFLISGDTGAGKSIILDGISMALYKTTPRLSSTANKSKNSFSDTGGEEINVASITQYTRLGISAGEESYSELVFEGNDKKTYTARLTLGVYLGKTNPSTGKRPLKHRKPEWELKVEGKVLPKKTDIEEVISQAVGLSFEQFGRMAMLAQGQFASFLTGDKKERESILEQLTNTEHFTNFGQAIKNLYDKASGTFKNAETVFKLEKEHSIPDAELEELHQKKNLAETAKQEIENKIKRNQDTTDRIKLIAASGKMLAEALQGKAEIEEKMAGEEYKQLVELLADWNFTMEQRRKLSDMRNAVKDKEKVVETESDLRENFTGLSADLLFREKEAAEKEEEILKQEQWLGEREKFDILYTEASAVGVKIENFIKTGKDIVENKEQTETEQGKSEGLQKALEEAAAEAKEADEAVNAKQQEINTLTDQRQQLKPEDTNNELSAAVEQKNLLSGMQTALKNIEEDSKKASELHQQIEAGESTLAKLKKSRDAAQKEHDAAAKKYDESRNLYSTMEMSLDEKIVALRDKLIKEHADTCPLCGQPITKISMKEEFEGLLSPLEAAQNAAKEKLEEAKGILEDASKKHDSAGGELAAQKKAYDKALDDISKKKTKLDTEAKEADLDVAKELNGQLEDAIGKLDTRIAELKKQQQDAVNLQNKIDKLYKEKKPLDKKKSQADKKENTARQNMDNHKKELERLAEAAAKLAANLDKLKNEISEAMAAAYPDWADDAEDVRTRLKEDAGNYNGVKKSLTTNKSSHDVQLKDIDNIKGQCEAVTKKHGDWEMAAEPLKSDVEDIHVAWRELVQDVQSASTKIEGYDSTISECAKLLKEYYLQSGKSEKDLDAIEARANEIESVQKEIKETEAALQSRKDAITNARNQIAEAKEKLGVEEDDAIPELDMLEEEMTKLSEEKDRVVAELSGITTRLEADSSNKQKVEEARVAMEKAGKVHDKWNKLNSLFGGTRLRTLVQTYILRPLLINANLYLERITDRYTLTCSSENEQLSILVLDRYNKNQVRSVTVLSGGERFMISLALSLALSSLNRPDMNVDILFIDEGFGTLDEKNLDSVMQTLERLQEIAGESQRRVGIISHREELNERIPVQIEVQKKGEGRSHVKIKN